MALLCKLHLEKNVFDSRSHTTQIGFAGAANVRERALEQDGATLSSATPADSRSKIALERGDAGFT